MIGDTSRTCESTNSRVLSWHGATFSGLSSSMIHCLHVTSATSSSPPLRCVSISGDVRVVVASSSSSSSAVNGRLYRRQFSIRRKTIADREDSCVRQRQSAAETANIYDVQSVESTAEMMAGQVDRRPGWDGSKVKTIYLTEIIMMREISDSENNDGVNCHYDAYR